MEFVKRAITDWLDSNKGWVESSHTISADETVARRNQLVSALSSKERRDAFVRQEIEVGLPFQIRAMRKARNLSQGDLGDLLEKPQSVISRLENPGYGRFTINTLLEIASAFDVALQVAFVPFSSVLKRASEFSISDSNPASHKDDIGLSDATLFFYAPVLTIGLPNAVYGPVHTGPIAAIPTNSIDEIKELSAFNTTHGVAQNVTA